MAKPPLPLHNQSEVNSDVTQPDNFNVFVIFISCAYCVVLFLCFYLIPLEFFLIYALSYFIETKKYTVYFYTIYTLFIFFFLFLSWEAHNPHEMQDMTFNKASRFISNFIFSFFCLPWQHRGGGKEFPYLVFPLVLVCWHCFLPIRTTGTQSWKIWRSGWRRSSSRCITSNCCSERRWLSWRNKWVHSDYWM